MRLFNKYLSKILLPFLLLFLLGQESYAQTIYDWKGTVSTDWKTPGNWSVSGVTQTTNYPGVSSTDIADIGVNVSCYLKFQPVISSAQTVSIGALNLGDNLAPASANIGYTYAMTFTVNGTLNISGAFTQKHSTTGTGSGTYSHQIQNYVYSTGATGGTINCASFNIGDSNVPAASSSINVTQLKMGTAGGSGSKLAVNVSGNMTIYSPATKDASNKITSINDAEFSFAAGTLSVTGQIILSNVSTPYTATGNYVPLDFFSMDLFNNSDSPVLNLYNSNPFSINTSGTNINDVDFYNIYSAGGTGTSTVNYAASGNQEVYTYKSSGMNSKIDFHPGLANANMIYNNVTFSGSGTKTVDAGSFYVGGVTVSGTLIGGNITISGAATVDLSTNNPTPTVSGNFTSASGTTFTNGSVALTIPGTTSNAGTFNNTHGAALTFTGAFTNSGSSSALNINGGGATTFSNSLTNAGTLTQGTSAVTVAGTVTNTGTMTLGSANFTFSGDYTNNGTFTAGTGTAIFSGITTQQMKDGGNGTTFNNVLFSGNSNKNIQSGSFAVSSTGIMTLSGTTTHVVPTAANNLTFKSDANGSATLAALPTGCTVNNSVTVQRFIPGGSASARGYRLLSPSTYTTTNAKGNNIYSISYLLNSTYISGTAFPPTSSNPNSKTGNPSLYLFRENLVPSNSSFTGGNFRGISDLSADPYYQINIDGGPYDIPAGNGYLFFFRGGPGTITPFSASSIPASGTLASTGGLNQGTINVTNWYNEGLGNTGLLYSTTSNDIATEGMNLVGNPYPSTIDWNNFSSSNSSAAIYGPNLTGAIYLLNPGTLAGAGNYTSYIPGVGSNKAGYTGLIASGEGFFVQTTSANSQLTFTESAKTTTQATGGSLFMANKQTLSTIVKQQIRLEMQLDSMSVDETLISFNPSTRTAFNIMEDARYRTGTGKVNLATVSSDNVAMSINQLPLAQKGDTIRLRVGASASGTYTLKLESAQGIPYIYDIWLKDAFTKDSVNLRNTSTYSFTVNTGDTTTFGAHRFVLTLQQDPALAYKLISFDAQKSSDSRQVQISWKTQNEEDYTHFTVERSNDNGKTYNVIGGMISSGAGTYGIVDPSPEKGDNLYRLEQEDFNSTISYSNVVDIQFANNGNENASRVNVYPNPAISDINLNIVPKSQDNAGYDITISNSSGKVVKFAQVTGTNWQDNVSNLLIGTYVIKVTDKKDNSVVGQTKFVKL